MTTHTEDQLAREAARREQLAKIRLNGIKPSRASNLFKCFWIGVLLGIAAAMWASVAHASDVKPSSHHAQVRHALAVHRAHRLHALRVHARDVHRAALVRPWTPIAACENGGWNPPRGYAYPDSLGINRTNWFANGGGSDLRPFVQAKVAYRIQNPPPVRCPW